MEHLPTILFWAKILVMLVYPAIEITLLVRFISQGKKAGTLAWPPWESADEEPQDRRTQDEMRLRFASHVRRVGFSVVVMFLGYFCLTFAIPSLLSGDLPTMIVGVVLLLMFAVMGTVAAFKLRKFTDSVLRSPGGLPHKLTEVAKSKDIPPPSS